MFLEGLIPQTIPLRVALEARKTEAHREAATASHTCRAQHEHKNGGIEETCNGIENTGEDGRQFQSKDPSSNADLEVPPLGNPSSNPYDFD